MLTSTFFLGPERMGLFPRTLLPRQYERADSRNFQTMRRIWIEIFHTQGYAIVAVISLSQASIIGRSQLFFVAATLSSGTRTILNMYIRIPQYAKVMTHLMKRY